jgi:hypothetical protein
MYKNRMLPTSRTLHTGDREKQIRAGRMSHRADKDKSVRE